MLAWSLLPGLQALTQIDLLLRLCPAALHLLREDQLSQNMLGLKSTLGSADVAMLRVHKCLLFLRCLEKLPAGRKHRKTYLVPIVVVSGVWLLSMCGTM